MVERERRAIYFRALPVRCVVNKKKKTTTRRREKAHSVVSLKFSVCPIRVRNLFIGQRLTK